eukprot:TRINITY_DN16627_c0_g1_i2.p1 TRINITY_DN16627_c0_g1~~TRINITY_DN16627_c0_g1_i2.p1  ORF type:complete len:130 (-),score=11.87 TRINITY_DN16627_c0_g1_i2:15-404(-)
MLTKKLIILLLSFSLCGLTFVPRSNVKNIPQSLVRLEAANLAPANRVAGHVIGCFLLAAASLVTWKRERSKAARERRRVVGAVDEYEQQMEQWIATGVDENANEYMRSLGYRRGQQHPNPTKRKHQDFD